MSSNPQDDADRIRLKRLAKLQTPSASPSPKPSASTSSTPSSGTPLPKPKPTPTQTPQKRPSEAPLPAPVPQKKKAPAAPAHLDLPTWEHETIGHVFNVTLSKEAAENSAWEVVWLKHLAAELEAEDPIAPRPIRLSVDIADRLLISRLELDPQSMSDDLEYVSVLASLPPGQTIFEYLLGSWKRINAAKSALNKKGYPPLEVEKANAVLEKLRDLVISYAGLTLQEPEMFPQPSGRAVGPPELVAPLLSLSTLTAPLLSTNSISPNSLSPTEVESFLQDLVKRFEPEGELDAVLGPVVCQLCFHESLFRPEGIAGSDASWRGVLSGLEALVSIKPIALMITRLPQWNPEGATAVNFEKVSLLGPLLRQGVFEREWPTIANTYFSRPKERSAPDLESATASLRGTLKSLQSSLFLVFNTLVRASPESREAVLQYFARVVTLNEKRAGMQVEPDTVASDSFMVNLQAIMFRFCEPFMDANFSKIDRIDALYYAHSNRINLKEETRINATSEQAETWRKEHEDPHASPPNFISDIYYLTLAMNHYGYQKTIDNFEELAKQYDEMNRHLEMLQGDGSWRGTIAAPRTEAAIKAVQNEQEQVLTQQYSYQVQLADPELVFRSISFVNFVSTWIIRLADPKHTHPNPPVELPLPKEVPVEFSVLPEYLLEDIANYHLYAVRSSPQSLELSGKAELLTWALTFLMSTWYIKNPFLKAKLVEVLFYACVPWSGRSGLLNSTLNSHPMALKYLIPALVHFYIEVEQTGASSQFYDKFNSRRNIAYLFKVIWDNPMHREALKNEARTKMEKFIRFVNLMNNDVTYLMDESLSEMSKIHEIQTEMADPSWATKPWQHRREREQTLRGLERHASGYTQLCNSTVSLLKLFTAETPEPFMAPEIVDRLAAMLDYNLDALVGPRCQELKVANPEKYKFNPKQLLSDILQVYLNLGVHGEFARAVAADGRSYRKELFERAAAIAQRRSLKSPQEIERLLLFVTKVEETKATLEAEEDLGEIPDEFLDPLMFTLMRDPVILPSSRAVLDRSTIKSHLLSDSTDPFNRMPLTLDDVTPNVELKERIDAFLAERQNKNTAYDKPAEEVVKMDIDAE
ncbi:ubiquitin conjugation factor E4 [Obba rivulosa]|uniref:RING-type E3 ubiquitin transferase n=1 Tax=Obba rivulosa TaxID=1052685 RepID=A0A8E2DEX9_9APHY|nr:ubiquitin conjugation factor E4 [Obba rivulosa]